MAAASVLVFVMARDGFLDRVEGVVLFFASIGYTLVILGTSSARVGTTACEVLDKVSGA
jgi:hypothetical protein